MHETLNYDSNNLFLSDIDTVLGELYSSDMLIEVNTPSIKEEVKMLLDLAACQTDDELKNNLREQAFCHSRGFKLTRNFWIMVMGDEGVDQQFNEELQKFGRCLICMEYYKSDDGYLMLLPTITMHCGCILGMLPMSDFEVTCKLQELAAERIS